MLCVHPQHKREAAASLFLECFWHSGTQIHVHVTPGRAFRMRQIPPAKKEKKNINQVVYFKKS